MFNFVSDYFYVLKRLCNYDLHIFCSDWYINYVLNLCKLYVVLL